MACQQIDALVRVHEQAERRWFNTALRARLDDSVRHKWKARFMMRSVLRAAKRLNAPAPAHSAEAPVPGSD